MLPPHPVTVTTIFLGPGRGHPSNKNTTMFQLFPIGSMYGIFAYIYHEFKPNVGKYSSPMDP